MSRQRSAVSPAETTKESRQPVPAAGGLPRGIGVVVAGVMIVSGVTGFLLNRTVSSGGPTPGETPLSHVAPWASESLLASEVGAVSAVSPKAAALVEAVPAATGEIVAPVRRLRVRAVTITPPADPFEPTEAESAPALGETPSGGPVAIQPATPGEFTFASPVGRAAAAPKPSPSPAPSVAPVPAGPRVEELSLTGIIQGEPPLAVVRYGGQSHFLKIGDRVADSWRLEEIKERSAVLKLGEERVEIPIQGGSSQ